jgi:hypothetical protein
MELRLHKRELIASGTALALLLSLVGPAVPRLGAQNAEGYEIEIISGANLVNSVKRRVASETIVEVHDRNRKPVAGVILTFTLPQTGAGGTFTSTSSNIATVVTGPNGQAAMPAFQANDVSGSYDIGVSGQQNGSQFSAKIHVTTNPAPAFVHSAGFKVLMVAALAGAGVGTYFGVRGGGGTTKTTVTPGTPSIGPARIPGGPR